MQLEHTILDADREVADDLGVSINDDGITVHYHYQQKLVSLLLSHDQFKQIWRLVAHFNQIQEAESCNK
jgi:uncharacterized protein YbgA (DUF1722 family)